MRDDVRRLKTEIALREAKAARLIRQRAKPALIYAARQDIDRMYEKLRRAEGARCAEGMTTNGSGI